MDGLFYGFCFLIGGILLLVWNMKRPSKKGFEYMQLEGYILGVGIIVGGIYVIIKEAIKLLK